MKIRRKNNKGFSLIELLGALVILAIISVVTIVSVTKFLDQSREQKVVQNKKNVSVAAELYLQANRDLLPTVIGASTKIPLSELRRSNYIKEDVTNSKNETCMEKSYIKVTKLSENDYYYDPILVCGDDEPKPEDEAASPYLEVLTDSDGNTGKILFSSSSDVKKANFSFTIHGSETDPNVGLYSYSYIIQAKTGYDEEYTELFNSGIIDAKKAPVVEFKSRALGTYVDLAGVTNVRVKVTALNEQGGYLAYDASNSGETSASSMYEDTTPPICPDPFDYTSRLGEPQSLNDWVNKNDIGTNKYPRIISLKCDDGAGSGCKRETFSEAWPNISMNPDGVMFGRIVMEDNAVIDENGEKKASPNTVTCPINVFVDLQSPTVELEAINPHPSAKHTTNSVLASTVEYPKGNPIEDGGKVIVYDLSDAKTNSNVPTELSITEDDYLYLMGTARRWMNKENYEEGVEFHITASDNLYLSEIKWEVNRPGLSFSSEEKLAENKDKYNKKLELINNSIALEHDRYDADGNIIIDDRGQEGFYWNRNMDTTDPMYIDEIALLADKDSAATVLSKANNTKTIVVKFMYEGIRRGVLTVKDRAGNTTTIKINANLDVTEPDFDKLRSNIVKSPRKSLGDKDAGANVDENLNEDMIFDPSKYSNGYYTYPVGLREEFDYVDEIRKKILATWGRCKTCGGGGGGGWWGGGGGGGGDRGVKGVCEPETTNGYGIDYGHDIDAPYKIERERSGCYKLGSGSGDNGDFPEPDYTNNDVFRQLILTGKEYVSGTWSNRELVCGPHDEEVADDSITVIMNGVKVRMKNINGDISGHDYVEIDYYRQVGTKISEDDPDMTEPMYDFTQPEVYYITKRDRTEWPVFKDQGTHRLYWSNCDEAVNCAENSVIENIKIDTIAPNCNNRVEFEGMNSDGDYDKENHNGWLYDQQTATVSHDCSDTSNATLARNQKGYFLAHESNETLNRDLEEKGYSLYEEFSSGCIDDPDTTSETKTYYDDIYTCVAGTRGVGAGKRDPFDEDDPDTLEYEDVNRLGQVMDVAGNIRYCTLGATIRKDTVAPACQADDFYKGVNGDGNIDRPNHNGWAMKGMTVTIKKACIDNYGAKRCAEEGCAQWCRKGKTECEVCDKEEEDCLPRYTYEASWAVSNCTTSDDIEFAGQIIKGSKTNANGEEESVYWNGISYVPSTYETTLAEGEEPAFYAGEEYENHNNVSFDLIDGNIQGMIGGSPAHYVENDDGEMYTSYEGGRVIDRAGNISTYECAPTYVQKDITEPSCSNQVISPNVMWNTQVVPEGTLTNLENQSTWVDDLDGTIDSYRYVDLSVAKRWVGLNGKNGQPEYAKIIKGCIDNPGKNILEGRSDVKSGCHDYRDPEDEGYVWYYGYYPEYTGSRITRVNLGKIYTKYGTYNGPTDNANYIIDCSQEVIDDAGNRGLGTAKAQPINIDYIPPDNNCKYSYRIPDRNAFYVLSETRGGKRVDDPQKLQRSSLTRLKRVYDDSIVTNDTVIAYVDCVSDEGSGCLIGNGRVITGEGENKRDLRSYKAYNYTGRDGKEETDLYIFDVARNTTKCPVSFTLRQDNLDPVGQCSYRAHYSTDGASDSFVEIVVSGIYDPIGQPDNLSSGIDWSKTYLNNGYKSFETDYDWHIMYEFYDDKGKRQLFTTYWRIPRYAYDDPTHHKVSYGGTSYYSGLWYSFFPTNIAVNPAATNNDYLNNNTDLRQTLADGTIVIRKPLTCSSRGQTIPYPMLAITDNAGNYTEVYCDPPPTGEVVIPACCDEIKSETQKCDDWEWTTCTKNCDTGETHEERKCTAESKFKKQVDNPQTWEEKQSIYCSWTDKQSEGTKCNTDACCAEENQEKICTPTVEELSLTFGDDNPCSFGQIECYSRSVKEPTKTCINKHFETVMKDEKTCKEDIATALREGQTPVLGEETLQYYSSREIDPPYTDPETGDTFPWDPVIDENGKIVPFEYYALDNIGEFHYYCDYEEAWKYLKDEVKAQYSSPEEFNCNTATLDVYKQDENGDIASNVRLYNYIASPDSCQVFLYGYHYADWVVFRSVDPTNCEINQDDITPTESNCREYTNRGNLGGADSEVYIEAYVNKHGNFDPLKVQTKGCNINVSWKDNNRYIYNIGGAKKYQKQNLIAVKCVDKDKGMISYCMESCNSGACVYR